MTAPFCKVTYKTCRNPDCRRVFVVVAALRGGCEACRRCRRDGYCSVICRSDAAVIRDALAARRRSRAASEPTPRPPA